MRAGTTVKQPEGFKAFIPTPLPPDPPLTFDAEMTRLLSEADRALGRLDGAASILPNADFFVAMYVRQEAVSAAARRRASYGGERLGQSLTLLPV